MSWKLTLEDIDQYKSVFAVCDKDHDGLISVLEMGKIMRTLGKNFSEKEFDKIIKNIKTEKEGYVELHEFLNLMAENKNVITSPNLRTFPLPNNENNGQNIKKEQKWSGIAHRL